MLNRTLLTAAWLRHVVIAAIAACGLIGSAIATAAPPVNDDCTGAVAIPSEGPFPYDTEPVDITDAMPQGSTDPISDFCAPIDRTIWYRFTPTVTGEYTFNTSYCVATGGASEDNLFDNVLTVLKSDAGACPSSSSSLIGCDDSACPCNCTGSSCGIPGAPLTDQAVVHIRLDAGQTYFIVLGNHVGSFVAGYGLIQVQVTFSFSPPNDTCSTPTSLWLDRITYGTTVSATDDYNSTNPACFTGVGQTPVTARGRDVVFAFTPPNSDTYSFRYVQDLPNAPLLFGQNPVLYLADNCPPPHATPPQCLAAANRETDQSNFMIDGNNNQGEEIHCVSLAGGTPYYLFFDDENPSDSGGDFAVEVTRCRNEIEPNNSIATATPFVPNSGCFMEGSSIASGENVCSGNGSFGCVPIAGAFAPAYDVGCMVCSGSATKRCLTDANCSSAGVGTCTANVGTCSVSDERDVDFYDLGAPPAGSKVFVGVDAAASNASDYELRITTASDTLGYDDNDGTTVVGTNAPVIAGAITPGGEIYARINSVPHSPGNEPYRLFARFETGSAQLEPAPDTTPDQSVDFLPAYPVIGGGFVKGTMRTAADTDCWKFLAHEGDNIMMFADNNPSRAAGNVEGNVWPVLGTLDDHPPSNRLLNGQILRNNVTPSPGTLTGFTPSVTSEFLPFRARYTGAHLVCFAETRGANTSVNNGLPTGAHPLAYQGSISINCGPAPVWGAETADVSVTKTGPTGPVKTGDVFDYTITVTNNSTTGVAEDVRLRDTLPTGLLYVVAFLDDGYHGRDTSCLTLPTAGTNDATFDCTTFSIAPGASVTYTLTVQVANCFGGGRNIVNTASITTASTDNNPSNDVASWTVTTSEDGTCRVLLCDPSGCIADACQIGGTCDADHVCRTTPRNCDDNNACTADSCDPFWVDTPTDHSACINDSTNYGDLCYDGNDCTADTCDPQTFCQFPPLPAGTSCNDFHICTLNDHCDGARTCVGQSLCDDGLPCTEDYFDESNNSCACDNQISFPGTLCDDGNACTSGTTCDGLGGAAANCNGGTALDCNDGNPCTDDACDPVMGCVHSNNASPCSDGNACTVGDACGGSTCHSGAPKVCQAENQCHLPGTCDPANGSCSNPSKPDNTACDDGSACTQPDTCQSGACVGGSAVNCDDGSVCTIDTCSPVSGCVNTSLDCSDTDACTLDTCDNPGGCRHTVTCQASVDQNAPSGGTVTTDPTGSGASPDQPIQTAVTTPSAGHVTIHEGPATQPLPGGYDVVNLQAVITAPAATVASPLVLVFRLDATALPSGYVLAALAIFRNGVAIADCADASGHAVPDPCVASRVVLGGGDVQITVLTSEASTWNVAFRNCDDSNPCTDDSGGYPACTHLSNTAACNDGNGCTDADACQNGACIGSPITCSASDQCHVAGACDPGTGVCSTPAKADGSPCSDGNACTDGDVCTSGACAGTMIAAPAETQNLKVGADKVTYSWSAATLATRYDVVRGSTGAFPVGPGGADESCFDNVAGTSLNDSTVPSPGTGFWYLSRGENACGIGTFGNRSNGSLRVTSTCLP